MALHRIFLLSPAQCGGPRSVLLVSPQAGFDLARRFRSSGGAPLGEVMAFLSGLYFRGKLAYARAFAQPPDPACPVVAGGVLVITPNAGLVPPHVPLTLRRLRAAAGVDIHPDNPRYRRPLERTARVVRDRVGPRCEVVLLGSIATAKYVEPLAAVFGDRLRVPGAFEGRGDMSRGALMLRAVAAGHELDYVAVRPGPRPRGPRRPLLPRATGVEA